MIISAQFMELPLELISQITLHLDDLRDIQTCALLNRVLRNLIESDVRIQYRIETLTARVLDNPRSTISVNERLAALRRREQSWIKLSPLRRATVPINHLPSGIYDLSGGVYFQGECLSQDLMFRRLHVMTKSLCWMRLPSADDPPETQVKWNKIDIGKPISDLGLALDEHDLVAIAYYDINQSQQDDLSQITLTYYVRLVQLSTGRKHPYASHETLRIGAFSIFLAPPSFSIEIVGDKLALLLSFPYAPLDPSVQTYVWNWKTGQLQYFLEAPQTTYQSLFFVTPDVIIIPNTANHSLEFYNISTRDEGRRENEGATAPPLIRTLMLPELAESAVILRLACRGEPNPMKPDATLYSEEPFTDSPEGAIIIFNILIRNLNNDVRFGQLADVTLIVHRSSLAKWIPSRTDAILEVNPVPFSMWGPAVTRWFPATNSSTRWITTTCGQRLVSMPRTGIGRIILRDFNKYTVNKFASLAPAKPRGHMTLSIRFPRIHEADDGDGPGQGGMEGVQDIPLDSTFLSSGSPSPPLMSQAVPLPDGDRTVRVVTAPSVLPIALGAFKHDVVSSLPFVECVSEETYEYTAALVDEKRILGLKLDENDERIVSIEVLNFA